MRRIVVTGAGGYIGRHVVKCLLDMGNHVIAVDVRDKEIDKRADFRAVDIFSSDPALYEKLGSPEIVVHMAWKDGFVHNSLSHLTYLPHHYCFLEQMLAGGAKQLVVMGTMHEVGYYEGEINENTQTNPQSLYGIAKNALRQSFWMLRDRYPDAVFQWLRAYYIYGDDANSHSIFSKIIAAEKEGKEKFPLNSGKNKYDFIQVSELAQQIAAAATQQEYTGIINCCTGKPVTLGEKVEEFIREHSLHIRPEYGAFPDRAYDSPAIWGNADTIHAIMQQQNRAVKP